MFTFDMMVARNVVPAITARTGLARRVARSTPVPHRFAACVILFLLLCGCAAEEPAAVGGVTTVEELSPGGYPIVRISGEPPVQPVTPAIRVGSVDGPNYFVTVRAVLLDRNGDVFVLSLGTRRILVFDSTGAYSRDIGRGGSGPGEYQSAQHMAWHGDTLLVLDGAMGRTGKFSARGEWLGSRPSPRMSGNSVKLLGLGRDRVAAPDYVWLGSSREEVFLSFGRSGNVDTIVALDSHLDARRVARYVSGRPGSVRCQVGNEIRIFPPPWPAGRFETPAADGLLAVAYGDRFNIVFLDRNADTVRVLDRAMTPAPVTDAEWSERETRFAEFRNAMPALTNCARTIERVSSHPVLKAMFHDASGNLWVEAHSTDGDFFEVFDRDLRLVRRVQSVSRDTRVDPYVINDRMAVVELDSNDVPFVRVYRIGGSP
jgi:pterin-4a-carbinolamine dehydratase